MSRTKDSQLTVLKELTETIETIGPEATLQLLRNARTSVSPDKNIQFVFLSVCQQIGTTIPDVTNGRTSTENDKYAKAFIVYYLRDFKIQWPVVRAVLNFKSTVWPWQLQKMITSLKPKLPSDAGWLQHKAQLDKKMKEYKISVTN